MAERKTKSIFEPDDDKDMRLDAEAWAAYRDGRYVLHAEVAIWLVSWGTSNERSRPRPMQ